MTLEDNISTSNEFTISKNKNGKYKKEISQFKKDINKLINIEVKHDILFEKL